MLKNWSICVIIPAFNEEESIRSVINDIPDIVDEIIVVNNGSSDDTANVASSAGATVLTENIKGYGAACLNGIAYATTKKYELIAFLDGDFSDYPEELITLLNPIVEQNYDFVLGSRTIGHREKGAMLPQALFGNWLASFLIKLFWGYKFTDLGPFRVIKSGSLASLEMKDLNYGWTVEMQIKAAKKKLKVIELPVSYRKRIGQSKVTGTIKGTVKASVKILYWIFKSLFTY